MRNRLIASLVVLGVVAAACGDDGEDEEPTTSGTEAAESGDQAESTEATDGTEETEPGDGVTESTGSEGSDEVAEFDPDGVVRLAYGLVASERGGFHWDPSASLSSVGDLGPYHWVYGGLMRPSPDGDLVPDLAEEVTVVDESTIEIVLREGLTVSDGRPLDAEMVKASLERNLEQVGALAFGSEFFNLSEIEVTSPTSLVLTIDDGIAAGWYDVYIAGPETVIVPPDTDFSQPVGAGPFVVTEFVPEERVLLEKNPDYWDAESIKLAGIELVSAGEGQAASAALNAGQVDWARLEVANIDAVGSEFQVDAVSDPQSAVNMVMCKTTEPFDDPLVRQALSLAIDREVINEALYGGATEPAWDLWPEGHRFHNPELTERHAYDPERAGELLAEAGYPDGFEFAGVPIPVGGMPELAQVVQQQFADVGVTMNMSNSANFVEDLYLNNTVPLGFVPAFGAGDRGKLRQWVGDSIGNLCGYENPELTELAAELWTVSGDSDEAVELWHQIQEILVDEVPSILVVFALVPTAFDAEQLGGVEKASYTVPVPDLYSLYVKA